MKVSKNALRITTHPHIFAVITALIVNEARGKVAPAPTAVTDNSTGVAGQAIVAVPTAPQFTYTTGTTLAPRAAFNAAIAKVDNAIAVLAKGLSDNGLVKLGLPAVVKNTTSVITTPGTVPALDKALAGVDGSGSTALLRSQANSALTIARNNLATVVRAYNTLAVALGQATINDGTGGKPDLVTFTFTDQTTAATAATGAGDVASDAAIDAALTALANDIAFVAAKINTVLFASASLTAHEVVLVP